MLQQVLLPTRSDTRCTRHPCTTRSGPPRWSMQPTQHMCMRCAPSLPLSHWGTRVALSLSRIRARVVIPLSGIQLGLSHIGIRVLCTLSHWGTRVALSLSRIRARVVIPLSGIQLGLSHIGIRVLCTLSRIGVRVSCSLSLACSWVRVAQQQEDARVLKKARGGARLIRAQQHAWAPGCAGPSGRPDASTLLQLIDLSSASP
jgi:hypothetical protein